MLDNFREILLRKCEDRELSTLIRNLPDYELHYQVEESLEKMAARKMPNKIMLKYMEKLKGGQNRRQAKMIYDALSHHASHYKSALKGGNDTLANKHAQALFKILHMAQKFDSGQLGNSTGVDVNAPSATPWQKAEYPHDPNPKNFGHKQSFDFLRGAPDSNYKKEMARKLGYEGKAYPIEEITVNGKHIHIDDDVNTGDKYVEHPFDTHPVLKYYSKTSVTDKDVENYLDDYNNYHDRMNPESGVSKWKSLKEAMGENYENRGSAISSPVHSDGKDISPNEVDTIVNQITSGQGIQIADEPKKTRYTSKPESKAEVKVPKEEIDIDTSLSNTDVIEPASQPKNKISELRQRASAAKERLK